MFNSAIRRKAVAEMDISRVAATTTATSWSGKD
jgi:hypothetical protein